MSSAFDRDLEQALARMDAGPPTQEMLAEEIGERAEPALRTEALGFDHSGFRAMEREIRSLRREVRSNRLLLLLIGLMTIGLYVLTFLRTGGGALA